VATVDGGPVLEVRGLVAGYVPEVDVLRGVDVDVRAGEMVTIVGPNGAGKSTLVKAIIGLLEPRAGTILLRGEEIGGEKAHRVAARGVGYVPQRDNVFRTMTVEENLELGVIPGRHDLRERLPVVLELFPQLARRRRQTAGSLSGGERQMLAIARTLVADPHVLLLDEPSAGLSPILADATFEKIAEIKAHGTTILMVEQNARRALAMSHRGYVLDVGQNRFEGTGEELLSDPKFVDLYLGGRGRIDAAN
jgi:ABC-type branched-subunit amino acid transport system ATPase component